MKDSEAINFLIAKDDGFESQLMKLVKTEYAANYNETLSESDYTAIGHIYFICLNVIAYDTHSRVEAGNIARELYPEMPSKSLQRIYQTRYIVPNEENQKQDLNVTNATEIVQGMVALFKIGLSRDFDGMKEELKWQLADMTDKWETVKERVKKYPQPDYDLYLLFCDELLNNPDHSFEPKRAAEALSRKKEIESSRIKTTSDAFRKWIDINRFGMNKAGLEKATRQLRALKAALS